MKYWSRREDIAIFLSCCRDYNTRGHRLENVCLHIVKGRLNYHEELFLKKLSIYFIFTQVNALPIRKQESILERKFSTA